MSRFHGRREEAGPLIPALSTHRIRASKLAVLVGDMLAMALAFVTAVWLASWMVMGQPGQVNAWLAMQHAPRYLAWWGVALAGWLSLLMIYQHYSDRRPFWDEVRDFIQLVLFLALLDMTMVALLKWNVSRLWWALAWPLVLIFLVAVRALTRRLLKSLDLWIRPTVIIGIGPNASEAALALKSQPEMGLLVHSFVDAGGCESQAHESTYPRLRAEQIRRMALRPGIQWVIALEHAQSEQREFWLRQLAQWGVPDISVIPAMRGVPLHGTDISHFFSHEIALLRMRNNLRRWPARLTKRIFDTLTASLLLLVLSPFMLAIALWVRRDGGPAFFGHPRIGKNGRVFQCIKFRSMVIDAEKKLEDLLQAHPEMRSQWKKEQKLRDDPRISSAGQFLRRTSLDELPQLINVIRGEMSLVGPRPVVQAELSRYADQLGYYLMVRPGMTGMWQISGRNDLDYDTRVYLDTWYVKNWSLWYDLVILVKTVQVVLKGRGAY
jgi:Undecaprenyl-phosphate galactose phosphotransferase WbaP